MKNSLLLLSFFFFPPLALASFPDVTNETQYAPAILSLTEKGILNGYGDGTFGPEKTLTRAELLKIVLESNPDFDVSSFQGNLHCFPDVESSAWYAPYVCSAKEGGIIEGFPDGTMKPNKEVSFVEAAKILVEEMGLEKMQGDDYWFEGYVKTLFKYQAVPSDTVKYFEQLLTRGEMSSMVWDVLSFDLEKDDFWFPDDSFVPYKYMQQNSLLLSGGIYDHEYESIEKNPEYNLRERLNSFRYGFGTAEVTGYLETREEYKSMCDSSEEETCETINVNYFVLSESPENKDLDYDINRHGKHISLGCLENGELVTEIYGKKDVGTKDCKKWYLVENLLQVPKPKDICTINSNIVDTLKKSSQDNPMQAKLSFNILELGGTGSQFYACKTAVIKIQPLSFSE